MCPFLLLFPVSSVCLSLFLGRWARSLHSTCRRQLMPIQQAVLCVLTDITAVKSIWPVCRIQNNCCSCGSAPVVGAGKRTRFPHLPSAGSQRHPPAHPPVPNPGHGPTTTYLLRHTVLIDNMIWGGGLGSIGSRAPLGGCDSADALHSNYSPGRVPKPSIGPSLMYLQ